MSLLTLLRSPQGITQRGLLAYYDCHEGSGTTLHDIRHGNDVAFPGGSANPTWNGQSLDFDGTDDVLDLPHFTEFDGNPTFTMQWVVTQLTSTASLWAYGSTATGGTAVIGIKATGGFLQAWDYVGNTVTSDTAVFPQASGVGLVTMVRDPSAANSVTLWLDDTVAAAGDLPDSSLVYGRNTLASEAGNGFQSYRLHTCLCYDTALTPGEIRQNYLSLKQRLASRGLSL